ncbi:opsin 7, group member b [Denticeps clupeoides]|uniref:G-protein coupled receptors family 1 profile domain-containing protein n=1 Tax=Denticeps clupeoides TaxID=299321 RepID=A0A8C4B481_9TELE|nr:opsin-5-like [Denticeps clupeoides]
MGNASEFESTISKENDYVLATIYAIFGVFSVLGNSTLLFVAYRKKSSLKPAEFFIINLSISDLGMTCTLFPLAIPSAYAHRWLFNKTLCLCYAFCGVFFGLASLTNLTVLSSVCWLKVCHPNYGSKFSPTHARLLVVGVWCYAMVFAVGPLSGWGQYGPEPYGTACCINWNAPRYNLLAMSYIISLFFFCYIVPCTIIFLSYAFILVTVRGSRQAIQQHVSPQNKITNAQTLIVKLSVAVCIGFLMAWSPYAGVSMWAAFTYSDTIPPMAFALAAIFAKSSTLYNPMVYLVFKPNFRKLLSRDAAKCRRTLCPCLCPAGGSRTGPCGTSQPNNKEDGNSTRLSNGLPESHTGCRHCPEDGMVSCQDTMPQRTIRMVTGSTQSEVAISQVSVEQQSDFL